MNSEQQDKLKRAALNKKALEAVKLTMSERDAEDVAKAVDAIITEIRAKSFDDVKELTQQQHERLHQIDQSLVELRETVSAGISMSNAQEIIDALGKLKLTSTYEPHIEVKEQKIELPKDLATNKSVGTISTAIDSLNKILVPALKVISARIGDDKQAPADFKPFRRVVKRGNQFYYDDSDWGGGGSGGAGEAAPTMLYQPINQSGAGTDTIIGAVADKRIRVVGYVVVLGSAGTVQFVSGSTDITGAMPTSATGGVSAHGTEKSPLLSTGVNEAFKIVTTGAAGKGHLAYFVE